MGSFWENKTYISNATRLLSKKYIIDEFQRSTVDVFLSKGCKP